MKTAVLALSLIYSSTLWAIPRAASCQMYSRDNETAITMNVTGDLVVIKMGDAGPDQCVLEPNSSYDLHARCGTGDDAVYFGVKRNSGKVYADFGTIAQLKNCRQQN
jgi:hypothetical protein